MDVGETLKRCTKCKREFPATPEYFYRHSGRKDGLNSQCKSCHNASIVNDPEKKRLQSRRYYEQNAEKIKAQVRKRYRENREAVIEYVSEWQGNHPDRVKAYKAKYRSKNRLIIRENQRNRYHSDEDFRNIHAQRVKRWATRNPEAVSLIGRRKHARRRAAEGNYTPQEIRQLISEQCGLCAYCGMRLFDDYEIDHVVPLSRGGTNWVYNLLITCPSCNHSKSDKLPGEWTKVRGW